MKLIKRDARGVVIRGRRVGEFTVRYEAILTAERLRSRRGLDLHTPGNVQPIRIRCRRRDQLILEHNLRIAGVRVVDCWGAIVAPTLLDFEEELDREPASVRQSSDNA